MGLQQRLSSNALRSGSAALGGSAAAQQRHGMGDHFGSSRKVLPLWEGSHWTSCGAHDGQERAKGGEGTHDKEVKT